MLDQVENEDIGVNEYPFDPSKIEIVSNQISIFNIVERLKNNEINLSPDFQRKPDLWKVDTQSRLIESLVLGIPLQAFYFDVQKFDDGLGGQAMLGRRDCWNVIDGLQRLSSIRNFIIGGQRLKGLEYLRALDGKTFEQLSSPVKRSIMESTILVYLIKAGTPEDIKFNIFKRVNTGGMPLTQQEIRHALFNGKGTALLERLANVDIFKRMIRVGGNKRMIDREFLNRFLAFYLLDAEESYKSMDTFLNDSLRFINRMSDDGVNGLYETTINALETVDRLLGRYAFRRYNDKAKTWSPQVNKALFEVVMVGVANLLDGQRETIVSAQNFIEAYKELFMQPQEGDLTLDLCINKSTGDRKRVLLRHDIFRKFLRCRLES